MQILVPTEQFLIDYYNENISCSVQSDNKILVFTQYLGVIDLKRYTADGIIDPSFTPLNGAKNLRGIKIILAPDDHILLAGIRKPFKISLLQLLPNGLPDEEWNNEGIVSTDLIPPIIPPNETCKGFMLFAAAIENNGNIVLGGGITTTSHKKASNFFIRYRKMTIEEKAHIAVIRGEEELTDWWNRLLCIDSEDICSICLEHLTSKTISRTQNCHHLFHKKCLGQWMKDNNNCPLCRTVQE